MIVFACALVLGQLTVGVKGELPNSAGLRLGTAERSIRSELIDARFLPNAILVNLEHGKTRRRFLFDTGAAETYVRASLDKPDRDVRLKGQTIHPEPMPDATLDAISGALETKIDGILGVDFLSGFYLGLDVKTRSIALFEADQAWEEISNLWFGTTIAQEGQAALVLPYSASPRAIGPTSLRQVARTSAGLDTVMFRNLETDPSGRLTLGVSHGKESWRAIVDTASSWTIGPDVKPKRPGLTPLSALSIDGPVPVRRDWGPLTLNGLFPLGEMAFYRYERRGANTENTVGLDVLSNYKMLMGFSPARLEVAAPTQPSSAKRNGATRLYYLPEQKWADILEPLSFPYEPGWYVVHGDVAVEKGRIVVNGAKSPR